MNLPFFVMLKLLSSSSLPLLSSLNTPAPDTRKLNEITFKSKNTTEEQSQRYEIQAASMKDILEKYSLRSAGKVEHPSLGPQSENGYESEKRKEIANKSQLFSQIGVEDIQGLEWEELHDLEKMLERELQLVLQTKSERMMNEMSNLQKKMMMMMMVAKDKSLSLVEQEQEGQSFKSINNDDAPLEEDYYDTSLKL